ncbi:MAG: polyphosphate kinase 1 [bacterium]|nr:polyphosphate kinase 1 [bacterium]
MPKKKVSFINREISWLAFNDRVLQEANDVHVPLLERLKFLGIFSSNLDEFFRVRVATNKRMLQIKKGSLEQINQKELKLLLKEIHDKVIIQQAKFNLIYHNILDELKAKNIFFINEKQINIQQVAEVRKYFKEEILNAIFPLILSKERPFPFLRDNTVYLACKLKNSLTGDIKYALIPLPTKVKKRFFQLKKQDGNTFIMFVDDVIRINLDVIFSSFDFDSFEAYTIKLTRDAEIDLDNDLSQNLVDKLSEILKQRKRGVPVRFIHDAEIAPDLLKFINLKLKIKTEELIPGQRYHNFKDFISFPDIKRTDLKYQNIEPLYLPELDHAKCLFDVIKKRDYLLSHPYQPFGYVVRLLREAAIDPTVFAIKITLYRVAENSNIVNALINAVKNGKKVFVVMELKARFDEEHNIFWSTKLREAGATVLFGLPKYKIHTKMCLIYRKEANGLNLYAHLGTGNYNGETSRIYCDHSIFTCNKKITQDVSKVFNLIEDFKAKSIKFTHLLVAPMNLKASILKLIDIEIRNKKAKKEAFIVMKMNSLVDAEVINKLYDASNAGVKIQLIIRGICCLVPGVKGQSENISVISIIDRFLEHARIYVFANGGKEKMYLGSADMMTRNLENRIEICFPVMDPRVKAELDKLLEIQLSDNAKARIINQYLTNDYAPKAIPRIRSQEEFYNYLKLKYSR